MTINTMDKYLESYLSAANGVAGERIAAWLNFLRFPIACFNRGLPLGELTFDLDTDVGKVYAIKINRDYSRLTLATVPDYRNPEILMVVELNRLACDLETFALKQYRPRELNYNPVNKTFTIVASAAGEDRMITASLAPLLMALSKHKLTDNQRKDLLTFEHINSGAVALQD